MLSLQRLFEPLVIKSMRLRNRVVMAPMVTNYASLEGEVTQRLIDYFVARARGGVGLIVVEASYVSPDGKGFPTEVGIDRDELIPGLRRLVDAVHAEGAKIAIQLYHGGRQTHAAVTGQPIVAPSPIPDPVTQELPHELTLAEIAVVQAAFAAAAGRAKAAGFDAVEIHGAHGYLIAAFLSPFSNRRMDRYGGGLTGRARFAVEIVRQVRAAVGEEFPILFRMSGEEPVEGALTLDQTRIIAQLLEEAGVDALHISVGNYPSLVQLIPGQDVERGSEVRLAAAIKQVVSVPVITVGRLDEPLLAAQVLADGSADLIALGRGLLADPAWPNKVQAGQIEAITPCIACNQGCIGQLLAGQPISCLMNPVTGREAELGIVPAATRKEVVVVGGGPAGLEAARVLAQRGHHVRLIEAGERLGGELAAAAMVPRKEEVADALRWLIHDVEERGVEVQLGTRATPEQIAALQPDAVVVATGGHPIRPRVRGVDDERVMFAHDVLLGTTPVGSRVLVVGAGAVGLEVAEYLAVQARQVTVVEMTDEVGRGMEAGHLYFVTETLHQHRATLLTNLTLEAIEPNGFVRMRGRESPVTLGPFDTIVLAVGYEPNGELYEALAGRVPEVYRVGDAAKPRSALEAIREGAEVAVLV